MVFHSSQSEKRNLSIVIITFVTNDFSILFRILKPSLSVQLLNKYLFRSLIVSRTTCGRHLENIIWQAFNLTQNCKLLQPVTMGPPDPAPLIKTPVEEVDFAPKS
jgi:hypothetical protein